uniref:Col_cuticle_N domain-containing protein n=1 Tax=Steinernema glaseri TaxID=37863 RepID=A0A1I7Z2V1_9BILA
MLFFVILICVMLLILGLIFWYIHNQLELYRKENERIDQNIKTHLERIHETAIGWTKAKMGRATRIAKVRPRILESDSDASSFSVNQTILVLSPLFVLGTPFINFEIRS